MNNEIHRTWWAGTHEKRDYPSKGDFSNFNFYKTKEKKKKRLWHGSWNGTSVKVTIIVWDPTTQKLMARQNLHRLLQLQSFHYEPRKRINHITRRKKKNPAQRMSDTCPG